MNELRLLSEDEFQQHFRGAFFGCAVGDALGLPLEGQPIPDDLDKAKLMSGFRTMPGWPPGQISDDTMLTLALAKSIIRRSRVVGEDVLAGFSLLWREGSIVGAGAASTDAVTRHLYGGKLWKECGAPVGSAGNGAAMRAAPIGLWHFDDITKLIEAAVTAAVTTHHDPRSIAAAVAVSLMTSYALTYDTLDPQEVLPDIAGKILPIDTGTSDQLIHLADWMSDPGCNITGNILATGQFGPWKGTWAGGITAYAIPTLLISFYAFLLHQDDFGSAVTTAIRAGGDTDTTGAITGALAGARNGYDAIPEHLRTSVVSAKDIASVADTFHRVRFKGF